MKKVTIIFELLALGHLLLNTSSQPHIIEKGEIVQENAIERGAVPWIVALLRTNNRDQPTFFCGGTLITAQHILTGKNRKQL